MNCSFDEEGRSLTSRVLSKAYPPRNACTSSARSRISASRSGLVNSCWRKVAKTRNGIYARSAVSENAHKSIAQGRMMRERDVSRRSALCHRSCWRGNRSRLTEPNQPDPNQRARAGNGPSKSALSTSASHQAEQLQGGAELGGAARATRPRSAAGGRGT
jgi:hypothetical protein